MMEDSKSSDTPRCSCGFFGSASTQGMCSKCYKAHQEKKQESLRNEVMRKQDSGKPLMPSTHGLDGNTPQPSSSKVESCFSDMGKDSGDKNFEEQTKSVHISTADSLCLNTESQKTCLTPTKHERLCDDTSNKNQNGLETGQNSDKSHISPSPSSTSNEDPGSRGTKRDIAALEPDSTPESTPEKKQKNSKRCYHCKTKLELAQRQIGRCRCDFIFCALHRLPELHNCDFDHKEDGRREARQKMVKPTRHLGNAFRRLDSDS